KGSILAKMKKSYRDRAADAEAVRELLDSIKGTVIVCGDFNDVPASWAYRKVRGDDMSDAYADTGFGLMNTYNMHSFWFHIDHVLYRGAVRPLSVQKGNVDYSDHFPLIASFALTPNKTQKKK
ncbi:MAG TPA: endonuclease, partial [Porphyromonadaceae bacterium]|nr:endonuclease [Porphyromonadaceae bacterium]